MDYITSVYKWGFIPKTWTQNGWLWHVMGFNGLNDKYLEGALHHVNMAGPQCQEFNTDFILKNSNITYSLPPPPPPPTQPYSPF